MAWVNVKYINKPYQYSHPFNRNNSQQLFGGGINEIQKHFKWKLKTNFHSLFYYVDTSVLLENTPLEWHIFYTFTSQGIDDFTDIRFAF